MKAKLLPILALTAGLAACVSPSGRDRDWEPEYVGRTLRVEAANGQVTNLSFQRGGDVVATFNGRETRGRWDQDLDKLCFTWAGSYKECWPHDRPFRSGRTEAIKSDRGNLVRVTLLR
jgi:hypothetical protein